MRTASLAPQSPAPDPAQGKKSSALKKYSTYILLFSTGLLLGLGLFFPRQAFWDWLLLAAEDQLPGLHISRHELSQTTWRSTRIHNLQLDYKNQSLIFPEVQLTLGLTPLLQANILTGPQMSIELKKGKQVFIQGDADLSRIWPAKNLQGTISIQAHLDFQNWDQPPVQGSLQLQSKSVVNLKPNLTLQGVTMKADLQDNRLIINSLQAKEPFPFSCTGQVLLQWSDILNSKYQVQGELQTGKQAINFEQQGRLADLAVNL